MQDESRRDEDHTKIKQEIRQDKTNDEPIRNDPKQDKTKTSINDKTQDKTRQVRVEMQEKTRTEQRQTKFKRRDEQRHGEEKTRLGQDKTA
jgi:hypothetical protein